MSNEFIALIANVALTLSFIIGLVFGIAQVKAASRDRRERLTLQTLHSFETREFAELLYHVTSTEIPSTYEEWKKESPETRIRFIEFGQRMESLGLLLAERLINVDLVDKTLGSFVVASWNRYKILFMDMRQKQEDPFLGEYFQWIAEQIDRRLKENPRKPFFELQQAAR